MWPVLIRELPLGITSISLQNCISKALDHDEQLELSSLPKVHNDEAILYLKTQEIQMKLSSEDMVVQCGDKPVAITIIDKEEAIHWMQQRAPSKKKVIARALRAMHPHHPQTASSTKGRARSPPPIANAEEHTPSEPLLSATLPSFSSDDAIVWYQYFDSDVQKWYQFSAEWSWDIEGQWILFQEQLELDPKTAETQCAQFYVEDMLVDLFNMKVMRMNREYSLKRSCTLLGTLSHCGCIEFELSQGETVRVVYDQNTGCNTKVVKGQRVMFEALWNKNDDGSYIHDVDRRQMMEPGQQMKDVHREMLAFNVRPASNDGTRATNQRCAAPSFANEFKGQMVEAVVVSLTQEESHAAGCVVCFPYSGEPQRHLALLYDSRVAESKEELAVNMTVRCRIGTNPIFDRCATGNQPFQFKFVAMNISQANGCYPLFGREIVRKHRGKIMLTPTPRANGKGDGFIFNECDNNMCTLLYDRSAYKVGGYVRYNEVYRNNGKRTDYVAKDVVCVDKLDRFVSTDDYVLGQKVHVSISKHENFYLAKTTDYKLSMEFIVETISGMDPINGTVIFGIDRDGYVIGQKMNKAKRHYVKTEIENRIGLKKLKLKFKRIIDTDGYVLVDNNIVLVEINDCDVAQKVSPYQETEGNTIGLKDESIGLKIQKKINEMMTKGLNIPSEPLEKIMELIDSQLPVAKELAWSMLCELEATLSPNCELESVTKSTPIGNKINILSFGDYQTPFIMPTTTAISPSLSLPMSQSRHPKSLFLEWAQKTGKAAPKATYDDELNVNRNTRIWSCQIVYEDKIFKNEASKKKDAEQQCFQELWKYVQEKYPLS